MTEIAERFDKLADNAKEAAARVHASTSKTPAKLESQISEARTTADRSTQELKSKTAESHDEASQRWNAITQEWHTHIAAIQAKVDAEKEERAIERAKHRADWAEADAIDAIDFANTTLEWAEWAVLDAHLARIKADELAAAHA